MKDEIRNSIKTLTRTFYDYQRERIRLDGRLGTKKDGTEKKKAPPKDKAILMELYKRKDDVFAMEQALEKTIKEEVHKHPLWSAFLKHVKGCGEVMGAIIISEFDIHIATTVSKLWAFAGLAPGKDKKQKGEKCPYNQFLKSKLLGVLATGFLKANSEYRSFYDDRKHRMESKDWGTASKNPTDKTRPKAGHQHRDALRYMVKMFLINLYIAWRTLEGLPMRVPYQEEYLGHKHTAENEKLAEHQRAT